MRILVTGGTGLVGSHAIERLAPPGHDVLALVRTDEAGRFVRALGGRPVTGAVEDERSWAHAEGCDAIVHAAALVTAPTTWDAYRRVNVEGTRLAAQAAARNGARLVQISSVAVYGRRVELQECGPIHEFSPLTPIAETDYYARSKRLAEEALWETAARSGISAVALRPCVIYGERERLFMGRLLRLLRLGIAPLVGDGRNRLAMVYAGSVAEAVVKALEHPEVQGPVNTANDGALTQRQFYETIAEAMGRKVRLVRVPLAVTLGVGLAWQATYRVLRPGRYTGFGSSSGRFMTRDNPYTSDRATRELGWRPSTPPHDALHRTVRWFMAQGVVGPAR